MMSDSSVPSAFADFAASIGRFREQQAESRGMTVAELDAFEQSEEARRLAMESAREARRRRERVASDHGARVPAKTLDAFIRGELADTPAMLAVREWLAGDKSYCILLGGTGVGKTIASLVALAELGGSFIRSPDLGAVIEPWKADMDRGVHAIDPTIGALIVLDDLGVERREDTRWVTSFDELIDARQGKWAGLPMRTLITSNLTPDDIAERYSERARDRIRASRFVRTLASKSMRGEP